MAYYTLNEVRSYSSRISQPLNENLSRRSLEKTTIFLSHSHKDADIIKEVIAFFLAIDIYIYVDWLDPSMPAVTSAETASKIKSRIKLCDKFVIFLTENSKESKWVPWELGYSDGVKSLGDIAIFPVLRSSYGDFKGLEYMELYPQIKVGNLNGIKHAPAVFPPTQFNDKGKWLKEGWVHERNVTF